MKKQLLLKTLLLVLTTLLTACNEKTNADVRIAHNSWPGYEPLVVAEHEGLYKKVNVTNFRVGSATEAIRAFEHKIVDVVALTLDEALLLQNKHPEPLVIIAVLDISNGGDAIVAQHNITSLLELKGKRVGVESTALGIFFLTRALDVTPDININQLDIIPLQYNHHYDAFMSKQVDAVVTFEPLKSVLMAKGAVNIFDSTEIPNEIVDVLITRKIFSKTQEVALRELIRGYFAALERINSDPGKYHSMMADFEGVSAESFTRSMVGLTIPDRETNRELLGGDNPELISTIQKIQQFMLKKTIIHQPSHVTIQLSDDFIQAKNDEK